MLFFPNAGKYKCLLQGKGSQIQIDNKTIIEFGSRRKWGIIKASVCVICLSLRLRQITQTSALIIPHSYSTSFNNCLLTFSVSTLGAIFEAKLTYSASPFLLFLTARFIIFCQKGIDISRFNFELKNNVIVLWTDNLVCHSVFYKKVRNIWEINIKSVYDLHIYRIRTWIFAILDSPEDRTIKL